MDTVIKIENLSKLYRLGEIGTGTISHDLNRWWQTKIRGKEDPYTKIGQVNDRTQKAAKGEHIWALKDINLEVKQGEVLGIIGKNGAGKSTLLKLLSRVTSPTTGTIKTKGRLASLLEVGTGFHPEMTGRENIFMNGTIMGMRKWEIEEKLDEIDKDKENLRKVENKVELIKLKIKNVKERKEEITSIDKRQDQIKKNVGAINIKKLELNKNLEEIREIMGKNNCSVKDCNRNRNLGDRLFCHKHRDSWGLFCFTQGIIETIILLVQEKKYLTHFQNNPV